MKFLFYDVETANPKFVGSICAVGWYKVQGLEIIDHGYTLINPNVRFWDKNVEIHEITEKDVINAPTFKCYWIDTLCNLMKDCVVVSHSAGTDISATEQALFDYDIEDPGIEYIDFLPVAQHMLPELKHHTLDALAEFEGISFRHHCAEDDAYALFEVAKRLCEQFRYDSIEELFLRNEGVMKNSLKNNYVPSAKKVKRTNVFKPYTRCTDPVEKIDDSLHGCVFCVTGDIGQYGRDDVERMILEHGGEFKTGISRKINILVTGTYENTLFGENYISDKHKKALDLVEQGFPIQIISADQFIEMMKNPSESPYVIKTHVPEEKEDEPCNDYSDTLKSPEKMEAIWDRFVREDSDDQDAFSCEPIKNGFSYFVYGRKAIEVTLLKKSIKVRVVGTLEHLIHPTKEDILEDNFYTLEKECYEVMLARLKSYKHLAFRSIVTEKFACCSDFMKCSDAKECLHPNDKLSNGCYYRTNLEKGLIFYGKNRNADEHGLFKETY